MNKKASQYILLLAVLGIWGFVGFRFFNYLSPAEEADNKPAYTDSKVTLSNLKKDYPISCNYPDPFLKDEKQRTRNVNSSNRVSNTNYITSNAQKQEKTVIKKQENVFPAIQLAGVISNKQNGKKSAILVVDGQEYSLTAGETVNGLKISKIFGDSIMVTYQKKNKIIRL